jgi:hypothetical protein
MAIRNDGGDLDNGITWSVTSVLTGRHVCITPVVIPDGYCAIGGGSDNVDKNDVAFYGWCNMDANRFQCRLVGKKMIKTLL